MNHLYSIIFLFDVISNSNIFVKPLVPSHHGIDSFRMPNCSSEPFGVFFATQLLTLIDHLADINEEVQNMYDRLVKQLAEQEGVTEQLKGKDPLEWVAKMNNINLHANEIVF